MHPRATRTPNRDTKDLETYSDHAHTCSIQHKSHKCNQICLELQIHCHSYGHPASGLEGPVATGAVLHLMARSRNTTSCSTPPTQGIFCSRSPLLNTLDNTSSPSFLNISPSATHPLITDPYTHNTRTPNTHKPAYKNKAYYANLNVTWTPTHTDTT